MSGAFNIDIEVGQADGTKKIKIYCASLTDTWTVDRDQIQVAQFHASLSKEQAIIKNKLNIGPCPKTDNLNGCELFLSRLACTAVVLRIKKFHDFLSVPVSVRDGLTYASHKAFGKSIREGYMQRHPRFVRRGGGKRWIRLTKDERGGSLICYLDENNKNSIISSLKIGASTEIQNLNDRGIPNAFVLKSGKRQWVLQATSARDYTSWQSQLINQLKEFGPVKLNENANSPYHKPQSPSKKKPAQQNTGKLLRENTELQQKIKNMKLRITELASEIDRYKDLELEMKTSEAELRRKGQKKAEREREELIATYEVKQDNLRGEIEQFHQRLEQKTADESGRSGLKSLFGDDYVEIDINDYKQDVHIRGAGGGGDGVGDLDLDDDEDEDEMNMQMSMGGASNGRTDAGNFFEDDEEEGLNSPHGDNAHIKYLHKHLHRHDHKHIHDHRHTHIHDQTGDAPITYTQTHTIAHTITHTMTQFKIKKNTFGI